MNSKLIFLFLALCLALGVWGCEDVPADAAGTVKITGVVRDLGTGDVVQNATVFLNAGGNLDSVVTGISGSFAFEVNVNALADGGTITVKKSGYEVKDVNVPNANATTFDITIKADLSTSALITGTLRDSTTLYPLRGGVVILTLPGVVDQFTTLTDGNFRLVADLVDRDSLPVTLTSVKDGYKTKTIHVTVHKGQTTDLANVLMQIDAGSSVATVLGRVIDNTSRNPVSNATVTLATPIYTDSVVTGGDGSFTFTVNLQGLSTIAGTVKAAKSGYRANTFNFSANSGQTVTQDISIVRDTTTGVPSAVPVAAITPQSSTSVMSSIEPSSRKAGMRTSGCRGSSSTTSISVFAVMVITHSGRREPRCGRQSRKSSTAQCQVAHCPDACG
mgnify:CR=1 FL=1